MPRTSYSAAAARRAVGVSQRCLDYWDERGIVKPSVVAASGKGSVRAYSFDDLLRLSLVKRLREAGLSLQRIQKATKLLRKRRPNRDALLDEMLVTDGKALFRRVGRDEIEDVLGCGQLVFSVIAVGHIQQELSATILKISDDSVRGRSQPSKLINVARNRAR